ncbi:MAG: DoxX family protein [bacterium]|nr:DoxX family protein [bacterium]
MKSLINWVLGKGSYSNSAGVAVGLLVIRLATGLIMSLGHGYGKLIGYSDRMHQFPDPLGVSSPVSLALTVFAEFFCGLALAAGFLTRAAVIPLIITMLVAVLIIHINDPFKKQELGLLYLAPYLAILLMGPGKLSLDYLFFGKK